jgi:hypothetical protein
MNDIENLSRWGVGEDDLADGSDYCNDENLQPQLGKHETHLSFPIRMLEPNLLDCQSRLEHHESPGKHETVRLE